MASSQNRLSKISSQINGFEDAIWWTIGLALALALRLSLFQFQSGDYVACLAVWYDYIQTHDGFAAFKDHFSNYTPPYLYLLWLATKLPVQKLYAIKLIALPFDFLLAFIVLLIIRVKYPNKTIQMLAFFATLFAPTVIFNNALWSQCDAMYTSFLLAAVYYLIRKKPVAACICFSVALSFKTQAIFLSPLFLILFLKNRVPVWSVVLFPTIYFLFVLPSWIAGRPVVDVMTMHWQQAETFSQLTMNAPNFYQWLPDDYDLFDRFGIVLALTSVFLFCLVVWKSKGEMHDELIVRLALLSVLLVPFFLPRMHERYFFPADVLTIIYAFYVSRYFFVPLVVGLVSLFSYFPFLFGKTVIELSYLAMLMAAMLVVVAVDTVRTLYPRLWEDGIAPQGRGDAEESKW
jgi:Gpi18-like mannosyltransferase